MKIAIDISPLESGHKVRGVGFYLSYLKNALLEYYPENEYHFFKQTDQIPTFVDLVHYPYFDPFFLTIPFFKKQKTIVTVHDLTPLVFPKNFPSGFKGNLKWQAQRFNLKKTDGIITDSQASKKDIEKFIGVPSDKITVAYLAAGEEFKSLSTDEANSKNLKKKYDLPDEFLFYVGDATWNKNLPLLLQVVKEIDFPLIMAGKALASTNIDKNNVWNSDLVIVQKMSRENKKVKLLGFVPTEDLVALYNLATVFVFPSIYEGFGLPILEAMQSGCPVITTRESCMPEIGGDAAYYFDGFKTESLVEAIKNVTNSKRLQEDLSKSGLKQAERFSWEKTAEKTIEAYKKALIS